MSRASVIEFCITTLGFSEKRRASTPVRVVSIDRTPDLANECSNDYSFRNDVTLNWGSAPLRESSTDVSLGRFHFRVSVLSGIHRVIPEERKFKEKRVIFSEKSRQTHHCVSLFSTVRGDRLASAADSSLKHY